MNKVDISTILPSLSVPLAQPSTKVGRSLSRRTGIVMPILLGLLSVMLIFVLAIAQRKSGQIRLLTLVDQSQIARFFLESYLDDVVCQLRLTGNTPNTPAYEALRQAVEGERTRIPLTAGMYTPSPLLESLRERNGIVWVGHPELYLTGWKTLSYPTNFQVDPACAEKQGYLEISGRVFLSDRIYGMKKRIPLKLVMVLSPLLKEFVLYCDQLHLEQLEPFGAKDRINILYTKRGEHPAPDDPPGGLPIPSEHQKHAGKPWIIYPTEGTDDPNRHGKVFFGRDESHLFFNLAGEANYYGWNVQTGKADGPMCDLWVVQPDAFVVNTQRQSFMPFAYDTRPHPYGVVAFRGLMFTHPQQQYITRLGILGFSAEITDRPDGHFLQPDLPIDAYLGKDPAFIELARDRRQLALAAAIKPYGLALEWGGNPGPPPPPRAIFGNVFARFFVISIWNSNLGPVPLEYVPEAVTNRAWRPPEVGMLGVSSRWEPSLASETYRDYMSRLISGGHPQSSPADRMPYNLVGGKPRLLTYQDFKPADQARMTGPFIDFARQWVGFKSAGDRPARERSLLSRICKFFPDQTAFKEYVGLTRTPPRMWLDGVLYVKGPLELPDLVTDDIHGGAIVVDGPVSLGKITRGLPDPRTAAGLPHFRKWLLSARQRDLVTFISLNGDPIVLREDLLIGVQVISLKPGLNAPATMVTWQKGDGIILAGGVAVSTPNLVERIKEFKRPPAFFYVPAMGDATPERLVYFGRSLREYETWVE